MERTFIRVDKSPCCNETIEKSMLLGPTRPKTVVIRCKCKEKFSVEIQSNS